MITEAQGLPLVVFSTPANVHDSQPMLDMLDAIPPIQGPRGAPRWRPEIFQGDAAYGSRANVAGVRARGILSLLSKPKIAHGSGLGKYRYVVERTLAWFGNFRRLKLCYERKPEHFLAFHDLAAALICARRLSNAKNE